MDPRTEIINAHGLTSAEAHAIEAHGIPWGTLIGVVQKYGKEYGPVILKILPLLPQGAAAATLLQDILNLLNGVNQTAPPPMAGT